MSTLKIGNPPQTELHPDGTVSYWSFLSQRFVRNVLRVPIEDFQALTAEEVHAIEDHQWSIFGDKMNDIYCLPFATKEDVEGIEATPENLAKLWRKYNWGGPQGHSVFYPIIVDGVIVDVSN